MAAITLAEAKRHLQIPEIPDPDNPGKTIPDPDFDNLIDDLISDSVSQFEQDTGHVISTRQNVDIRMAPGADFDLYDSIIFPPIVDFIDDDLAAGNFATSLVWAERPDVAIEDSNLKLLEVSRTRVGSPAMTYYRNTNDKMTPFAPIPEKFLTAYNTGGDDRPNGVSTPNWLLKIVITKHGLDDKMPSSFKIPIKMIMQHAFQHGQTNIYGTNQIYTSLVQRAQVNLSILNKPEWLRR